MYTAGKIGFSPKYSKEFLAATPQLGTMVSLSDKTMLIYNLLFANTNYEKQILLVASGAYDPLGLFNLLQ